MSEPISWTVTTHDWSKTVDEAHLDFVRDHAGLYGAGGVRHLVLEVLAYANDEAEAHGRGGRVAGAWTQTYRHGIPDEDLLVLSSPHSSHHGTTVTFVPDPVVPSPRRLAPSDLVAFRWLEISPSYRD